MHRSWLPLDGGGDMVLESGGAVSLHSAWAVASDVLGRASSPEPAEPSPFKPKPSRALTRAWAWLQISEARARGSSPGFDTLW